MGKRLAPRGIVWGERFKPTKKELFKWLNQLTLGLFIACLTSIFLKTR